jgi:hypothetical protein
VRYHYLKYTTGEATVEVKVLETSPRVSRNHLCAAFCNLSQWMLVISNVDLCPCRPGGVNEDTEAGKVRILRLVGCVCVPLHLIIDDCANTKRYN